MTQEEATDLIIYNQVVKDVSISGIINFSNDSFDHAITFHNCTIKNFQGTNIQFNKQVSFINCKLNICDFSFAYFIGGLEIINCTFENYLDFQCGGHNKSQYHIRLENSIFKGFVNFYDCTYDGPFLVIRNDFQKGTNILGNKNLPYETSFKLTPVIDFNKGALNLNEEGDKHNT
jgi:hypothetical protein